MGRTSREVSFRFRDLGDLAHKPHGGKLGESADKPGSVVGNHPSGTRVAARLERPTRKLLRAAGAGSVARVFPYLVLLQVGFAVPPNVATGAVRSYRTLSPLPSPHCCGAWAVCSLLHFPWAHAPQALPGAAPCGARTFLCLREDNSGCLADSRYHHRANPVAAQALSSGTGAASARARA